MDIGRRHEQALTPAVLHILLALADGELHGYAIMQRVAEHSFSMGPGTLYGSIKRMLSDGLIVESEERPDADGQGVRRRYYRLNGAGEEALQGELRRLQRVVELPSSRKLLTAVKA